MNDKTFYDSIRPTLFGGKLTQLQVDGIQAVFAGAAKYKVWDTRKLAYIIATVYHETAKTMQPISEYGKGKNRPYGRKLKMSGKPYETPDKIYYGRGLVQLTWFENYANMGKLLNLPLLEKPELLLTMPVSIEVLFEGMLQARSNFGDFTGKSLETYFNEKTYAKINDTPAGQKAEAEMWYNARRIINGIDAAKTIANYAIIINDALILSGYGTNTK